MKKWKTNNNCKIYQITKGRANSYLVIDKDISIMVDTGIKNSNKAVMGKLDDFLDGNDLSYLVLTHSHHDHVGNAAMLKEKYKTKVIIQKSEAEYLMNPKSQLIPQGTNLATRIGVGLVMRIKSKLTKFFNFEAVDPNILVDDDYSISSNCYLIPTPGHSQGSMSLIVDDEVALVGDAMFGVFWWSVFPPFAADVPMMIRSWGKLLNTGSKLFLPGHGTENSRELLEKQYNKYKLKYV